MLKTKFGWIWEQDVLHIDRKVTLDERQSIIKRFNDPQGRVHVLMLCTKACGEGITLTSASRVIFNGRSLEPCCTVIGHSLCVPLRTNQSCACVQTGGYR
jgi:hypothetical protein